MTADKFLRHLQKQTYDKNYQDIEIPQINYSLVGYSLSYKTWENIKDLVDWRGKTIIDLGTFHGYYSFQIEERGGSVIGLDRSEDVLTTTRLIAELRNSKNLYKQWTGGDSIPYGDITLCLNMLHHCKNQEKTLQQFKSPIAIFEQNIDQMHLIQKYYKSIKYINSHRSGRIIMLGEKIK